MKEVPTTIAALNRVLLCYQRGYTLWIRFQTDIEKVEAKANQWKGQFDTALLSYERQDKKERGIPTAVATSSRVLGNPYARELILMATPLALRMPQTSVWATQKWISRPPESGPFVMVHSPRDRGDYAWTWKLQEVELNRLSKRLTSLVKTRDALAVNVETEAWVKIFPMFRGVRSQFKRLLWSGEKLWTACNSSPWPGVPHDSLPIINRFHKERE